MLVAVQLFHTDTASIMLLFTSVEHSTVNEALNTPSIERDSRPRCFLLENHGKYLQIQLIAYNSDLYENFSDAMTKPRGLLAIAIIVDVSEKSM
jgi:hypothetical protein